jgi:hypothetical protein
MTPATLKLVVAWSDRRNLCSTIRHAAEALVGAEEVRGLGEDAFVVHTALTTADLRDELRGTLSSGEAIFVTEFEVWSAHGKNVDSKWLLARGH